MRDFLTAEEVKHLKEGHHSAWYRKNADRIKAILLLNKDFTYSEVAEMLLLDETTIRRYFKLFQKQGIDGLLEDHYHGSIGFLTQDEEGELTRHVREHTYQTVKEVVAYVGKAYKKDYSVAGMTKLFA